MIRLGVSTQTPPLVPLAGSRRRRVGARWERGRDYRPGVGGVVPMMRSLLKHAQARWVAPNPWWVCLGFPGAPRWVQSDEGFRVSFVDLPEEVRGHYNRFKRAIWDAVHGAGGMDFEVGDYRAFLEYSMATASRLLELRDQVDAYYVNDFQQIQVGPALGPAAPAVLRWHVPFQVERLPHATRRFFVKSLEGFDAVVVSTRRDLEGLIGVGFQGRAYQLYPYVDPGEFPQVGSSAQEAFRARWKLPAEGPLVLCVARMDPQKRQDLLLRALPSLRRRFPGLMALFIGNGSFTSSRSGGLGSSMGSDWRTGLERLARQLKVSEAVRFTGYLPDEDIRVAYSLCDVLVMPSVTEGFGLVGVEAWLYQKPIVVSEGAGISELVGDGVNGLAVRPGSASAIAQALRDVLSNPERAEAMGRMGALTSRFCVTGFAARRLKRVFDEVLSEYQGPRGSPTA